MGEWSCEREKGETDTNGGPAGLRLRAAGRSGSTGGGQGRWGERLESPKDMERIAPPYPRKYRRASARCLYQNLKLPLFDGNNSEYT